MVHDGSSFLVPGIFCFNNLGCGARSHAHDLNLEEGNVIGNFNGEFWGMFAGGGTTSGSGTTLLHIVFVCSMTLGTMLMCFLQKRDAKGEETLPESSHLYGLNAPSTLRNLHLVCMELLMQFVTSGVLGILYPLLMAAALGIGDGIFNTQLNALLGMLFKHDMRRSICTAQGLAMCFDRNCVFCEPLHFFACCVSGYACCSLHLCWRVSIPHSYGRESILLC
ncbi:unnamed protein product [Camellia sinensis]